MPACVDPIFGGPNTRLAGKGPEPKRLLSPYPAHGKAAFGGLFRFALYFEALLILWPRCPVSWSRRSWLSEVSFRCGTISLSGVVSG